MVNFKLVFSREADLDSKKLKSAGLQEKCQQILNILANNPFQNPPRFEKLTGNLDGYFSRRINLKHRLVYKILKEEKTVKILRMWSHYE